MKIEFQQSLKRNTLLPFAAIFANWAIIAGCIWMGVHFDHWAITALAIGIIGARQHALFVMIHESVHMHISRNKWVNAWTSDLFCAFPLLFDTEVYKKNHLQHHRHLNSNQDPDWIRKVGQKQWTFPASKKEAALFVPYFLFYRGPIEWAYILWRFSGFGEWQRWKAEPYFLPFKLSYFLGIGFLCYHYGVTKEMALYWLVPTFFVLPVVGRIRSIAEHFAITYKDDHNSTREVKAGFIEGFLFSPHNVNYHLTHHLYPHVPFYHLPKAHAHLEEIGEFKTAQVNESYFLPFGNSVLRDVLQGPRPRTSQPITSDPNKKAPKVA